MVIATCTYWAAVGCNSDLSGASSVPKTETKTTLVKVMQKMLVNDANVLTALLLVPLPKGRQKTLKKISGACQPKISSQCLKRSKPSSPNFAMLRSAFSTVFSLSRCVFEKNLSA